MKNERRRGSAGDRQRQRELDHQNQVHEARIQNSQSKIDNAPPREYPHVKHNMKREELLRQQYRSIDQENRRLLRRIAEIHLGPKCGREFEMQLLKVQAERRRRKSKLSSEESEFAHYRDDSDGFQLSEGEEEQDDDSETDSNCDTEPRQRII